VLPSISVILAGPCFGAGQDRQDRRAVPDERQFRQRRRPCQGPRSKSLVDIINNAHPELGDFPLAGNAGLAGLGGAKVDVVFADSQGSRPPVRIRRCG